VVSDQNGRKIEAYKVRNLGNIVILIGINRQGENTERVAIRSKLELLTETGSIDGFTQQWWCQRKNPGGAGGKEFQRTTPIVLTKTIIKKSHNYSESAESAWKFRCRRGSKIVGAKTLPSPPIAPSLLPGV